MKAIDLKMVAGFLVENIERFGHWIEDRYEVDRIEATVIVEGLEEEAEKIGRSEDQMAAEPIQTLAVFEASF